jgi:predicted transcriptional regulator
MAPRAAARLESLGFEQVYEYRAGKLDWLAAGNPTQGENSKRPRAGDVARKDVVVCGLKDGVRDVRKRAAAAGWDVAVVVDDARVVLGQLRSELLEEEPALHVENSMRAGPSTFRPYVPIKEMADYMVEHQLDSVPITTSAGQLLGVLRKGDAVREAAGGTATARRMITS